VKSFRIHTTLTLFACLAVTASVGCSSSNDSSTGCGALTACCATLSGEEQNECNAVINAADPTDEECTQELTTLSNLGVCTSIAQGSDSNSGGGSTGSGPANSSPSCAADGITVSACETLKSCCSELDVSQDPDTCITVAGEGTSEACAASLSTYQSAGTCTDVVVDCPDVPIDFVCHEVTSSGGIQTCVSTSVPSGTCPPSYTQGSCSNEGLAGCCVTVAGTTSGTKLDVADCIYDDSEVAAFQNACETEHGTWTAVAP
jgi:hypothetical protein